MKTEKATAIVSLEDKQEVKEFSSWLTRNKKKIKAMSRNDGCGCCVDMFYMLIDSNIEENETVGEAGSTFNESKLLYSEQKDKYIDLLIDSY